MSAVSKVLTRTVASRVYSPEVKTSPSLSRYRIELLDVMSQRKDTVDTGLTAISGRMIALSGDGKKLAVAGIDVEFVGSRQHLPVSREGIWLFDREDHGSGWRRSFLLKAASDDDVILRWTHDSQRLVLSERRLGSETVVVEPHGSSVRRLRLTNASPSTRVPVLASRDEQNGITTLLARENDFSRVCEAPMKFRCCVRSSTTLTQPEVPRNRVFGA